MVGLLLEHLCDLECVEDLAIEIIHLLPPHVVVVHRDARIGCVPEARLPRPVLRLAKAIEIGRPTNTARDVNRSFWIHVIPLHRMVASDRSRCLIIVIVPSKTHVNVCFEHQRLQVEQRLRVTGNRAVSAEASMSCWFPICREGVLPLAVGSCHRVIPASNMRFYTMRLKINRNLENMHD